MRIKLNTENSEGINPMSEEATQVQEQPAAKPFGLGIEIVYKGQPLKMPGDNLGLSVMPGTKGKITEPAADGWMCQFEGFEGEISVPESDLLPVGAPSAQPVKLQVDDLVRVDMKGEGIVRDFRAGGGVLVRYSDNSCWEPGALVHLVKTRQQVFQDQLIALQSQIDDLKQQKAAAEDRASTYKQRAEAAEVKAQSAPLPSIGEVDDLRKKITALESENSLLRLKEAGAQLIADDQAPGIQTRTIHQDTQTPEQRSRADSELNALRRAGWEILHIQFTPELNRRVVMLELDTTPASPIDDAIRAALEQPVPEAVEAPVPAVEGTILGLDDDGDDDTFTFKLEEVQSSAQLRQLWRDGHITAEEYRTQANRIVRQVGIDKFSTLQQAARKVDDSHPFRVKVARELPTLGIQEPPNDPMIFNRKVNGKQRPLSEFFDGVKS